MPEFDELRLQVSLVDNASQQLRAIKQSIDELGGGGTTNNLEKLKRQTSEVDEQIKKLIDTVSKGPRAFIELSRNVTIAGVSLGTFALAADKVIKVVDDMSRKLVELNHVAIRTGVDPAVIRQIEKAMERYGVSHESARHQVEAFAISLDEYSRDASKLRNDLYKEFPREREMIDKFVYQAINAADGTVNKFNAMKQGVRDLQEYYKTLGPDGEALGRRISRAVLERFGTPDARFVDELVQNVDDRLSAAMRNQIARAEEYEKTTARIAQNWESITKAMKVGLMDSGLIEALKWVDQFLEKWKKYKESTYAAPPGPQAIPATPTEPGLPVAPRGGAMNEIQRRMFPAPAATPQRFMGGGDTGGGGSGTADLSQIPNIGELLRPRTDAIRLSPIYTRGRRANVEDRRGETLLQTQNDETKTLITEMKRLNALLSGEEKPTGEKYAMLTPGGGGGGGYGPGGPGGLPGPGPGPGPGPSPPGPTGPRGTTDQFGNVIPGPGGQLMPAWVTTTVDTGGYAGSGAAGLVPGLPGGPSGRALTHDERVALGRSSSGGDGGGAGAGGGAPSGSLAQQREAFKKELDADPQLKKLAIGAMAREGGIQSNLEQLFNYASMRKMTIRQALYSGQYGPVTGRNRLPTQTLIRGGEAAGAKGEEALNKVYGGSNITDYATDQGMAGDPNFAKYMANRAYWNMHKVEGAWFSAHGERGRAWAAAQRARDAGAVIPSASTAPSVPGTTVGVSGLPGGPSGPALTREQRAALATPQIPQAAGSVGAPETGRSSAEVDRYLEYAALQTGIRVGVAHGLEGGHARHTAGAPAYDIDLYDAATGRKLDMRNADDLARYKTFVTAAVRAGATGVGAGAVPRGGGNVPYMGPHRIHVGGGSQIAWGAGGRAANAPGWLNEALAEGSKNRLSPQQVAEANATQRAQLDAQRKTLDAALSTSKKVEGSADVNINVAAAKTDEEKSPLKKVDMPVHSSGDKAESGAPAPPAATGSKEPSLEAVP